jgi:hypothetical protein
MTSAYSWINERPKPRAARRIRPGARSRSLANAVQGSGGAPGGRSVVRTAGFRRRPVRTVRSEPSALAGSLLAAGSPPVAGSPLGVGLPLAAGSLLAAGVAPSAVGFPSAASAVGFPPEDVALVMAVGAPSFAARATLGFGSVPAGAPAILAFRREPRHHRRRFCGAPAGDTSAAEGELPAAALPVPAAAVPAALPAAAVLGGAVLGGAVLEGAVLPAGAAAEGAGLPGAGAASPAGAVSTVDACRPTTPGSAVAAELAASPFGVVARPPAAS